MALSIQFRKLEEFQEFVQADVLDLSRGGIFIKTDVPRPVGTMVLMQIPVSEGRVFQLRGTVRHIRYNMSLPEQPPVGMGIEFAEMSEDEKELIRHLLEAHAE